MSITQYKPNCILYCEPIKNSIMSDGNFIRIIYANDFVTLNGIIIIIPFNIIGICKFYNKCKYTIELTLDELERMKSIETQILQNNSLCVHKSHQLNMYEHISSGFIKTFGDTCDQLNENTQILLKISGIWETDTECGVTYKFIVTQQTHLS